MGKLRQGDPEELSTLWPGGGPGPKKRRCSPTGEAQALVRGTADDIEGHMEYPHSFGLAEGPSYSTLILSDRSGIQKNKSSESTGNVACRRDHRPHLEAGM